MVVERCNDLRAAARAAGPPPICPGDAGTALELVRAMLDTLSFEVRSESSYAILCFHARRADPAPLDDEVDNGSPNGGSKNIAVPKYRSLPVFSVGSAMLVALPDESEQSGVPADVCASSDACLEFVICPKVRSLVLSSSGLLGAQTRTSQ